MDSLELDDDVVAIYLQDSIPKFIGPVTSRKFSGDQSNPTYLLTAGSGEYVLRRKPPGRFLKSAHAVEREYRAILALAGTGVPVPRTFHLCSDESVIGSVFFIMEYIEDQIYWDPALPGLSKSQRHAIYMETCRVLAALHQVDTDAVGLSDFGKPGNYFARQIDRWTQQYLASQTEIIALLDWELSTLGHQLADLAYQCMQLRMDPGKHLSGLNGIYREALGIPSEQEYVTQYCEHPGLRRIDNWSFYLVFGFFRFAAILQGVKKRAIDGNASSRVALEYAELVRPLAEKALAVFHEES